MNPNFSRRTKMLWSIFGLGSLLWFLIRVIPKPSRATYPCMRVAFPMASAFVVWLVGLGISTFLIRKARRCVRESRLILAGICGMVAALTAWGIFNVDVIPGTYIGIVPSLRAEAPPDPVNDPIGEPKGCHPGRVVWVHDPEATDWGWIGIRWVLLGPRTYRSGGCRRYDVAGDSMAGGKVDGGRSLGRIVSLHAIFKRARVTEGISPGKKSLSN